MARAQSVVVLNKKNAKEITKMQRKIKCSLYDTIYEYFILNSEKTSQFLTTKSPCNPRVFEYLHKHRVWNSKLQFLQLSKSAAA